MIEKRGSLFEADTKGIGQGVNCSGVMGAGIAKEFKRRFPNNFTNYEAACKSFQLKPGGLFVGVEADIFIFNMASQGLPGRNATYEHLFSSAFKAAEVAVSEDLDRIAIPMIGCGIGGLQWDNAKRILRCIEDIVGNDFEWEVWIQ